MASKHEVLIQTEDVQVRVMNLQPGEATLLHHHTEVTDHMVGLAGILRVEVKKPDETIELKPGARCKIPPGRAHQVSNVSSINPASYLLIQGVGRYDFKNEEETTR